MIIASAPSRIHIGLLDLTGIGQRVYGGLGIALEQPRIEISVRKSNISEIVGVNNKASRAAIEGLIARLGVLPTRIEVHHSPPAHHGYGSTTALLMAIAAGIAELWQLSFSEEDLIVVSGRGGTSGVGCRTFFHGGIVVDAGHLRNEVYAFGPSAARQPMRPPVMTLRLNFPEAWQIALIEPIGVNISGEDEIEFFRLNAPIPRIESLEAIAIAHHGIIPSLCAMDISRLKSALADFHRVGFKKREVNNQSDEVRMCLGELDENEIIAAGMSSFGPLLYAIYDARHDARVCRSLERIKAQYRVDVIYTKACNEGATLGNYAD